LIACLYWVMKSNCNCWKSVSVLEYARATFCYGL
jgi:hypothetical protein